VTIRIQDADFTLHVGDVREVLRELPSGSVDCVVTSPPYWGLRDYGTAAWDGGDPSCDHLAPAAHGYDSASSSKLTSRGELAGNAAFRPEVQRQQYRDVCGKCGAHRLDRQIGLEPTPQEYVETMVNVFREVRRVLADHGTVWLNLGDSYAAQGGGKLEGQYAEKRVSGATYQFARTPPGGLKPKDLVGIPWRVAFALQDDGWYLRSDIIWAKPNPMPESVTDRPTKAHEYVFLLAKGQWKARVVALADLSSERIEFGGYLGAYQPNVWAGEISIRLASAILDRPDLQEKFGLSPFDPQVWEKRRADQRGGTVASLPPDHLASILSARFLARDISAKEFLCEVNRLGVALGNRNDFRIGDGPALALPPGVYPYGNAAIAVDHPGEVRKLDFVHGSIVREFPVGCSYFFDQEAVREPAEWNRWGDQTTPKHNGTATGAGWIQAGTKDELQAKAAAGRNIRSVWTITTQPYADAHFATFPEELPRRAILAGCPEQVCRVCGKPRERIVETTGEWRAQHDRQAKHNGGVYRTNPGGGVAGVNVQRERHDLGWTDCGHDDYRPGTVLDPFIGSGTVAFVARQLHRHCVGIELNPEYAALIEKRTQQQSLFA